MLITCKGVVSIFSRFGEIIKFNLRATKAHKKFNPTEMTEKKPVI
jgi:hypothetical protein